MAVCSSYLRDRCAIADDLREHIRLAQDQDLVGTELDLGPAVLAEDDLVAFFEIDGDVIALVVPCARAHGKDAAALRLLLGGVRQDDAADRRLLFLEDFDDQAVAERLQIHTLKTSNACDRLVRSIGTLPMRVPAVVG